MSFIEKLKGTVKSSPASVVFSEGDDPRVMGAASDIFNEGLASKVILLGNPDKLQAIAENNSISLKWIEIINPENDPRLEGFAEKLMELRPRDFSSIEKAKTKAKDRLYFGSLLHLSGEVTLHISGAVETSANVIVAFYHIIKPNRREGVSASFFLMDSPNKSMGENGVSLFADCAVNIAPSPRFLGKIAFQIGNIAQDVFGLKTKLALLTYSTKGSGSGEQVDAMKEAELELQKLNPKFIYEVEMQADAAMVPEVSERKAPGNNLGGNANVLIFPDLPSGNIAYKLVERYSNTKAYGPIMVGLNKTASDLSRGASREDIVGTYVVAAYYDLKK